MNSKTASALLDAIAKGKSTFDACAALGLERSMTVLEEALRVSSAKDATVPLTIKVKKRGGFLPLSVFEGFEADTFSVKITQGKRPKITLYPIASEEPEETEQTEEETEQSEVPPQMQQQHNPAIRSGVPELARV
jgi:hypothetical protein